MLAFTSERLLYLLDGGAVISLQWAELSAADTILDVVYTIRSGERFFFFMLVGQSVLKWLAYTHLMVKQIIGLGDHKIHLGFI